MDARPAIASLVARIAALSVRERVLLVLALRNDEAAAAEPADALRRLGRAGVERIAGRRLSSRAAWVPEAWIRAAQADEAWLSDAGARLVCYPDAEYPALLRETARPPFALYVRGRLPGGSCPALAVVGTRYPTGRGLETAYRLGREAASRGVDVVSGLARGIDAASHRGALAAGGATFAVLGCGIDMVHPPSNKALAAAMLGSGGGLASEYPPGTPPSRWTFPERNRILAGLCRSTLVVEAPGASGALITAAFALEEGRDVYAAAACLGGPRSAGSDALAADGAMTPETFDDIMADWLAGPPAGYGRAVAPRGPGRGGNGLPSLRRNETPRRRRSRSRNRMPRRMAIR